MSRGIRQGTRTPVGEGWGMSGRHLSRKFESELENLRRRILALGELVIAAIAKASSTLESGEEGPALEVIAGDQQVNALEVEVDELCLTMIALYQPTATDLRFITTAMKITTTLERIGDLAVNICRYSLELLRESKGAMDLEAPLTMAQQVQDILRDSLKAFIDWDIDLALATARRDKGIDRLYKANIWDAVSRMYGQELGIMNNIMRTFMVTKFLERIGDHAVHICEMVVFMVKGQIIRHQKATLDYLDEEFH